MNYNGRQLLQLVQPLALIVLISGFLGWMFGWFTWAISLGLCLYIGWIIFEVMRFSAWTVHTSERFNTPPYRTLLRSFFDQNAQLMRAQTKIQAQSRSTVERIQNSTAALQDGVILLNKQHRLEWWNPAAEQLLGFNAKKDYKKPITHLVRHPKFAAYLDTQSFQEPLELLSPSNARIHLQLQITQYGNQEHLVVVRDISQLRQLEQMRKDFVSHMSHELRTPLTVIVGYLETMLEHTQTLAPRWIRALEQMQQQTQRMQYLLQDLLLLSRLESTEQSTDLYPVAIEPLLQSIVKDARALSKEQHQIQLTIDQDCTITGSEQELHSAFSNLIFNAIKYTPAQGRIQITWWVDTLGKHLSVADSGIGIEAHHIPRLTERFYRVDASRSSTTGGTGLGLAIVKHVLLRHNAHLEITSQLGQGSVFTCHLPHTERPITNRR